MLRNPYIVVAAQATHPNDLPVLAGIAQYAALALHVGGAHVFLPRAGSLGADPARWDEELTASRGNLLSHRGWVPDPVDPEPVEALVVLSLTAEGRHHRLSCLHMPTGAPALYLERTGPPSAVLRHFAYATSRVAEELGLWTPPDLHWKTLVRASRVAAAWEELRAAGLDELTRAPEPTTVIH